MYEIKGSCHCGNIQVHLELSRPPETYSPKLCDCDFCRKHGASYLFDSKGSLRIHASDEQSLGRYRQGSRIADCLFCRNCGVLVGVAYEESGRLFAAINSQISEEGTSFGTKKPVSPKSLAPSQKVQAWKGVWFPDVQISAGRL